MKHRELNPDEAINRVLTGLREVEPLEGMQHRVFHAARGRASTRRRWSLQLPSLATHSPWALAVAAVAVIAMGACWKIATIGRSHDTVHKIAYTPANLSLTNPLTAEIPLAPLARPRTTPESIRISTEEQVASVEPISDEDALAMSEMLAPSKPAPPLPLTHQERLLAEVVHRGAPEELASLRPDARAREIEIAKAEFQHFFEPPSLDQPPVKDNE